MKKLFLSLFSAIALLAVSCTFDDSDIWNEINSLKGRVDALEQLCNQMNTNISAMQTIVEALQNNDYVTNIAPVTEGDKIIGYTISFSKSDSITIYHGKDGQNGADGKDGYTPQIGIKADDDGLYYWTLDGEWLLDGDGKKIKAQGVDGESGDTPQLKIENDYWYVSYDNGTTWTEVGQATGDDGDSMFEEVTYDDDYVYITLADGTALVLPRSADSAEIPNNEIWYTSTDGNIITPDSPYGFGANIVSNVYENGMGIITFDGDVTSISESAFEFCTSLSSITFPESVTTFRGSLFTGCTSLASIYSKYASSDNRCLIVNGELLTFAPSGLNSYTIPDGVTSIGHSAFSQCDSLSSITIPDEVTSIGGYAFSHCDALSSINISEGVTSIEYNAFYYCSSLTCITIPDSVTSIGDQVFSGCSSLASFYGKYASADNRCLIVDSVLKSFAPAGLTSYTIPSDVTTIGNYAFWYCSSLSSITIPDSITGIGYSNPFVGCSSLTTFNGKYASSDNRCLIADGCYLTSFAPAGLTSYTIPNDVTMIGYYAFYDCDSLNSVTIPDSVTSIRGMVFYECDSLTNVTIPDSVVSMEDQVFMYCRSLSSITLPANISSLGNNVFAACTSLTAVYSKNTTPPSLGGATFYYCDSQLKIYVPTSSVNAYKSASGWSEYASQIEGYDFSN